MFCNLKENDSVIFLQPSYTSRDGNGARLAAISAWAGGNMPASDVDPKHGDQVILVTGCVF